MCVPAGILLFSTLFRALEDVGKEQRPWNQAGIGPCLATYWPEDRAEVLPSSLCQLLVKWGRSVPSVLGVEMGLLCDRGFLDVISHHFHETPHFQHVAS